MSAARVDQEKRVTSKLWTTEQANWMEPSITFAEAESFLFKQVQIQQKTSINLSQVRTGEARSDYDIELNWVAPSLRITASTLITSLYVNIGEHATRCTIWLVTQVSKCRPRKEGNIQIMDYWAS